MTLIVISSHTFATEDHWPQLCTFDIGGRGFFPSEAWRSKFNSFRPAMATFFAVKIFSNGPTSVALKARSVNDSREVTTWWREGMW